MRDGFSSKEPVSSNSDHERSFERTRDSYIACINRSLEHAFEFLSETGYASAGLSDAERVESRSDNETDGRHSDFIADINVGLKQRGVEEIRLGNRPDIKKEVKLGQLWGPSKVKKAFGDERRETDRIIPDSMITDSVNPNRRRESDAQYLNKKNFLNEATSEERNTHAKPGQKIIIYQHIESGKSRKHRSKSMENIGPKSAAKSGGLNRAEVNKVSKQNGERQAEKVNPNGVGKDGLGNRSKLHEREDSGYESKAEFRNDRLRMERSYDKDINDLLNKKNDRIINAQRHPEVSKREITPYLTTEREIFKQLLTNAKESEQIGHKHRKKSKSLSNLDLRRAASKVSLSPARQRPPTVKTTQNETKGFQKFRESFRRTTSYFMPHKFAFQQEQDKENGIVNTLGFQYHCMQDPSDASELITASKSSEGKKKGFFKHLFERKKTKPRLRRYFKSSEAISQTRWQSRENLNRSERKTKNERPISMLIDKVKEQTEKGDRIRSSIDDENLQIRRNSFKGFRFRRSESLRSIPSTNYTPWINNAGLRSFDNEMSEPIRNQKLGRNRPISVHGALFRTMSMDAGDTGSNDFDNLHRVLRNRFLCCSVNDIHSCSVNVDQMSLDSKGDDMSTSSSPRKNDDITEWIRGLQYSSSNRGKMEHDCFEEEHEIEFMAQQQQRLSSTSDDDDYLPETRIVNGQKQTYL